MLALGAFLTLNTGMKHAGENLRDILQERGLSIRDVHRARGPAVSTVSRLLAMDHFSEVHPSTLRSLAKAIGLEYQELVYRCMPQMRPPAAARAAPSAAGSDSGGKPVTLSTIVEALKNLSPDELAALRTLIDSRERELHSQNRSRAG